MTTMNPDVARRVAELRDNIPELVVLEVRLDGAAWVEFVTDDGERMVMLVPINRPDRPH
jgi:hypothetical protein